MKTLYFDVETTGLLPGHHEVVQLAYILDIDDSIVLEGNEFFRPDFPERVDPEALETTHKTIEELMAYPERKHGYNRFLFDLSKHIDKFDKKDKANPAAANGHFDLEFVNKLFESQRDPYFGSWQNWQLIDPIAMARQAVWAGAMKPLENYKLGTLCQAFKVPLENAHDALADTRAMRVLTMLLRNMIYGSPIRGQK